jgi:hypothetical protein
MNDRGGEGQRTEAEEKRDKKMQKKLRRDVKKEEQ